MDSKIDSLSTKCAKIDEPTTLESLPRDIILNIFSRVANTSLTDIRSVELVSKKLCEHANDEFVLKNLPLHQVDLFPTHHRQYGKRFYKFMKRCRQSGNPEAIYRKGLINYFHPTSHDPQRQKGLDQMAKAADDGNEEARYVYGLVLLCLGGENIDKGLNILSPLLTESSLSFLRRKLETLRSRNFNGWWWWGSKMGKNLKSTYLKKECNCDGKTAMHNLGWCRYGSDNDMPLASACQICVWDYEVHQVIQYI